MKTIFTFFCSLFLSMAFCQETPRFVANQLLVKLRMSVYEEAQIDLNRKLFGISSLDALDDQLQVTKLKQIGQHKSTRTFLLEFQNDQDVEQIATQYKNLGLFEYTTPNYFGSAGGNESQIIPNDTRFNRQWSLYNIGSGQAGAGPGPLVADADVDMELAWDIQTGDPNMIIAVVDGGARLVHPDLATRIWTNTDEIASNGIDDDNNGFIDDVNGWDFFFNDNDPTDERGHGTNVCSIIGAVANNGNLYTGANWNSKIMVLKSIDYDLAATYASVADAMYYAIDKGAKVINCSIGFNPMSTILEDFVTYAQNQNVLISACMMNFNNNTVYYPAGYSLAHSNVIACGSTSANDYRTVPFDWDETSGSNFGNHINVTAPGSYIYNLAYYNDMTFGVYWSGTSMATPLVASIASLVWAQNPLLTANEVRSIIENTAQDQVGNPTEDAAGFDQYMGHGRANAHAALMATPLSTKSNDLVLAQEFQIVNPIKNGTLQFFSKGQYPGEYDLVINGMDGKLLYSGKINIDSGNHAVAFNFEKGGYIVTFKNDKYTKIFKVLKE